MGWNGTENGVLLKLMAQEGFIVLLTTDQNLRHQQNLLQAGVSVIVLIASSNQMPDLAPLMTKAGNVLDVIAPGEVRKV